jgi:hypothetical protein
MRRLRFALMASVVACSAACAAIWGFDDLKPGGPVDGGGDTQLDTGSDSGVDTGPPCKLDHPEDPPGGDPGGGVNFLTAIDSLDIGTYRDGGGPEGGVRNVAYDLDDVCTCHGAGMESCIRPDLKDPLTCDDLLGRDDVGRALLASLQGYVNVTKFTSEGASEMLATGHFGVLIEVQGYNDTPDDPLVTVSVVPSFGLGTPINGVLPDNAAQPPTFTKNDLWTFDPRFGSKLNQDQVIGIGPNVSGSMTGYVRNGRLVAPFADMFISLQLLVTNNNPLMLHISDAIATARIVKVSPGVYELAEGRISGRWASGDALRAIGAWELGGMTLPGPLCPPAQGAYMVAKTAICQKRDIMTRGTAPPRPCDAVSFGLGFTAKPASVGDPAGYPYRTTSCFDGSVPTNLDNYPDNCP